MTTISSHPRRPWRGRIAAALPDASVRRASDAEALAKLGRVAIDLVCV